MAMRTALLNIFLLTGLEVSLGNSEGMIFPHTSASFADTFQPASAQAMLNDLESKVMRFITTRDGNDTSTATRFVSNLETAQVTVRSSHKDVETPDLAWDQCLLGENSSLHAWKVCKDSLESETNLKEDKCDHKEGVGSYTIDSYKDNVFSYKADNRAKPSATCNLETMMMEPETSPPISCFNFVGDIVDQAKEVFDAEETEYTTAKGGCDGATTQVTSRDADCRQKKVDYDGKVTECIGKETTLINKICTFTTKLQSKCTTLNLLDTELKALNDVLEVRNKEFRSVMRLKCLFSRYTNGKKCFDTNADDTCKQQINGASETYSTVHAQDLYSLRVRRDNITNGDFQCAVNDMTFGDGVRYEKSNSADDYSYYVSVAVKTYTTSVDGKVEPNPCGASGN
jgi:hypothetical protein